MSATPESLREALGGQDGEGVSTFRWRLSSHLATDAVQLRLPPSRVLPVVFVPGIMGSNLSSLDGEPVWRLDTRMGVPIGLAGKMIFKGPAARQTLLHPDRTVVNPGGAVPHEAAGSVVGRNRAEIRAIYRDQRGWGEVAQGSYHDTLLWLEDRLNGQTSNPARWADFHYSQPVVGNLPLPGEPSPEPELLAGLRMALLGFPSDAAERLLEPLMSDELIQRARFRMPVYACGYNWLASNTAGAERLAGRIEEIIARHDRAGTTCRQVVLITHSMGGLVARRCSQLPGMAGKIAGVVHGVMPATGAAVAYRRCKVGMAEEDRLASWVIGSDGPSVTAVFSQAPGALQLLPTVGYRPETTLPTENANAWLVLLDDQGRRLRAYPREEPYDEIYLERSRWWGLVRPEWLSPTRGTPLSWDNYALNITIAREFHSTLAGAYHPNSYAFYGVDPHAAGLAGRPNSFESITWTVRAGLAPDSSAPPPPSGPISELGFSAVRDSGINPLHVGGNAEFLPSYGIGSGTFYQTSHWEFHCEMQDGNGDGTVPESSGRSPLLGGNSGVRQQFRLRGFEHEAAFANEHARLVTLYSLVKIASEARA